MANISLLKDAAIHTLIYVCGADAVTIYKEGNPVETFKPKSAQYK